MQDDGTSVLARIRLSKRVVDVLLNLRENVTVETVAAGEVLLGNPDEQGYRGDFSATILNLKVRFLLLAGQSAESLMNEYSLIRARNLLLANPDTYSCILIVDDEDLSCRVVDSYHMNPYYQVRSAIQRGREEFGSLRIVIDRYFQAMASAWTDPPKIASITELDYQSTSLMAATKSLVAKRTERFQIPEKKSAQSTLSDQDAVFVSKIVSDVAAGENSDLFVEIKKRSLQ